MKIKVSVVVEPDGEGFHAYCPAFTGLHIDGKTQQEAIDRTFEALEWYFVSLARHGDPLPVGPDCVVEDGRPRIVTHIAPVGAILKNVEVPWPALAASGIS